MQCYVAQRRCSVDIFTIRTVIQGCCKNFFELRLLITCLFEILCLVLNSQPNGFSINCYLQFTLITSPTIAMLLYCWIMFTVWVSSFPPSRCSAAVIKEQPDQVLSLEKTETRDSNRRQARPARARLPVTLRELPMA